MTYLLPPRLLPSLNIFPSTPNLPPFTTHNTQHMAKDLVVPRYTRLRPLRILAATTPNSSFHFNHHPARTHERRPDPKNEGPNPRAKTRPKNEDPTQEPRPPAPVGETPECHLFFGANVFGRSTFGPYLQPYSSSNLPACLLSIPPRMGMVAFSAFRCSDDGCINALDALPLKCGLPQSTLEAEDILPKVEPRNQDFARGLPPA
ncbi:hypothetical protein HG531_005827 [Fusarium graminearum]|nr:hypothetical protein HG531_005827 [Fusarium graminearum]